MAKIKIWTSHLRNREHVLDCKGGVNITNDGVVNVTLPKALARRLGFGKEKGLVAMFKEMASVNSTFSACLESKCKSRGGANYYCSACANRRHLLFKHFSKEEAERVWRLAQ